MTSEDKYKVGEIIFYCSKERVDLVEVLSNDSDKKFIRYDFKVVEVMRESGLADKARVGVKFSCAKARNESKPSWSLR